MQSVDRSLGCLSQQSAARVRELLEKLEDLSVRERAAYLAFYDQQNEKRAAASNARLKLEALIRESRWRVDSDPLTNAARKAITVAEAEAEKVKAKMAVAGNLHKGYAHALRKAEDYLQSCPPDTIIKDCAIQPPKPGQDETQEILLQSLRGKISDCQAELARVIKAPLTSKKAKATARQQLAELAARGRPDVFGLIERGDKVEFYEPSSGIDQLPTMVWLLHDQFVQAIEAQIDIRADDKNALTDLQRMERADALNARILALEYQESALWWASLSHLLPRAGIDPRALLLISGPELKED